MNNPLHVPGMPAGSMVKDDPPENIHCFQAGQGLQGFIRAPWMKCTKSSQKRPLQPFLKTGGLEHVDVCWGECDECLVSHLIDLVGLGVEIGDLDQSVAHFDVVVMVVAHKARKDNLAGEHALVC